MRSCFLTIVISFGSNKRINILKKSDFENGISNLNITNSDVKISHAPGQLHDKIYSSKNPLSFYKNYFLDLERLYEEARREIGTRPEERFITAGLRLTLQLPKAQLSLFRKHFSGLFFKKPKMQTVLHAGIVI